MQHALSRNLVLCKTACYRDLQHMQRQRSDSSQDAAAAAMAVDSGSDAGSPPPPRPASLEVLRQQSIEHPRRSTEQSRPQAAFSAESMSLRPHR